MMIRTACLATALAAGTLLAAQSASATITFNGQVSRIVTALHSGSYFRPGDFSLFLNREDGSSLRLFSGIEDMRSLDDFGVVEDWLGAQSAPTPSFDQGYHFTHSVVGSFFGDGQQNRQSDDAPPSGPVLGSPPVSDIPPSSDAPSSDAPDDANPVVQDQPYEFTHEVPGSYFDEPESQLPPPGPETMQMIEPPLEPVVPSAPVPEPATWAMMIGGFALVGSALRGRRPAIAIA